MASQPSSPRSFINDRTLVEVHPCKTSAGKAGALHASHILRTAIAEHGHARLILAAANSQVELVRSLVESKDIDWSRVEAFHMDEYIGLPESHPASFRLWVKTRFTDVVHPGKMHYLDGNAKDIQAECRRYEALLSERPIHLCLLGIGENGHIAFNDPHVADFQDPVDVKPVELDEPCRKQQAGEGHFPSLESVPRIALTMTIPRLMDSENLICCVPEARKANAVKDALEGPIMTTCPGSIVRTHKSSRIYLDIDSASLLSNVTNSV